MGLLLSNVGTKLDLNGNRATLYQKLMPQNREKYQKELQKVLKMLCRCEKMQFFVSLNNPRV